MGKWLRKLWIGLLSGTAFLTACGLRPSPTYYGPPPIDPNDSAKNESRMILRQRIDEIHNILEERRNAEVYGPPEVMEEYARENRRLQSEADSLEKELLMLEKE